MQFDCCSFQNHLIYSAKTLETRASVSSGSRSALIDTVHSKSCKMDVKNSDIYRSIINISKIFFHACSN